VLNMNERPIDVDANSAHLEPYCSAIRCERLLELP